MAIKIGIVGMPNVGKSTLFNAITNSEIEAANYPFATIEPNVGVVEMKDRRLEELARIFSSKKTIYNTIEFVDIAGLVKGASKGEGLGNKFLSNIREVDAIVSVVRLFESDEIVHVEGSVDPVRDIETINLELAFSDIEQSDNYINKSKTKIEMSGNPEDKLTLATVIKVNEILKNEQMPNVEDFTQEELFSIKSFNFLTMKPKIYLGNLLEGEISNPVANKHSNRFVEYIESLNQKHLFISSQIEYEISKLEQDEQEMFLNDLGLEESGLNEVSKTIFSELNLMTFFTAGPEEAHAWSFKDGYTAPECAGVIHTDFQKGFIKAEVYKVEDIIEHRTELNLKNNGLIRLEGKDYLVKDGDVCLFRFNN